MPRPVATRPQGASFFRAKWWPSLTSWQTANTGCPWSQLNNDHLRSNLGVPLLRNDKVEGVLVLVRTEPGLFEPRQIELIKTFADQAVIAIENVRLFDEVQAKTRELTEALTYQTGSSKILGVIASSPTDVGPVLNAVVESACELCEAHDAIVVLKDGGDLVLSAHHGPIPSGKERWPNDRNSISGRAIADRFRCTSRRFRRGRNCR